jgi:hypothetical protein
MEDPLKPMRPLVPASLAATLALALTVAPLAAQPDDAPPSRKITSCNDDPGFHEMDFWLGEWTVKFGNRVVGTNRIEKILKGCALVEHWTAEDGSEGKSLFYYDATTGIWKQVWVTESAYAPGGLKEKTLVERMNGGGLRFQGEITRTGGEAYLDRTTLTPNPDGTVRQWIQISTDNGEMWTTVFDAIYERKDRSAR